MTERVDAARKGNEVSEIPLSLPNPRTSARAPWLLHAQSGSSLGELELPESDEAYYIVATDVQDCFYHIELPPQVRDLFSLPG